MSRCFVVGNGISRAGLDLSKVQQCGPVYGCNALYRDFTPDVLVSTDTAISEHIQHQGYSQHRVMYTRRPLPGLGAKRIPQAYYGFSSGPAAVGIAALDAYAAIYMIGFDMGPSATGRFNNVYSDTEFYRKSSSQPIPPGNWVQQIRKICADHASTRFYRVCGPTTAEVELLTTVPNLVHMPMADFLDRINTTKEF